MFLKLSKVILPLALDEIPIFCVRFGPLLVASYGGGKKSKRCFKPSTGTATATFDAALQSACLRKHCRYPELLRAGRQRLLWGPRLAAAGAGSRRSHQAPRPPGVGGGSLALPCNARWLPPSSATGSRLLSPQAMTPLPWQTSSLLPTPLLRAGCPSAKPLCAGPPSLVEKSSRKKTNMWKASDQQPLD